MDKNQRGNTKLVIDPGVRCLVSVGGVSDSSEPFFYSCGFVSIRGLFARIRFGASISRRLRERIFG